MYCWAQYPWVLFVSLGVTLDSTATPSAKTPPFLGPCQLVIKADLHKDDARPEAQVGVVRGQAAIAASALAAVRSLSYTNTHTYTLHTHTHLSYKLPIRSHSGTPALKAEHRPLRDQTFFWNHPQGRKPLEKRAENPGKTGRKPVEKQGQDRFSITVFALY